MEKRLIDSMTQTLIIIFDLFGLGRFLWSCRFYSFWRHSDVDREEYTSKMNGWINTILKSVILFGMSFVSFSAMEEVSRGRCALRNPPLHFTK